MAIWWLVDVISDCNRPLYFPRAVLNPSVKRTTFNNILETETQNMMHYVSYVNHRREFVEEMCFKQSILHEHRYISTETERKKKRERIVGAGRDKD